MSLFRNAVFHTTVADLNNLPGDSIREIAFAGRSNAGKSSAINTLANHTRLAYVSKTPGRTQHLNYFTLTEGKYFVDLPGYGFAKAPEEIRSQWEGLLSPYLSYREQLVGLVMIMDARHPLTELDVQMLDWFAQTGKPIHVLLSKADKLTRQEQALVLREVQVELDGAMFSDAIKDLQQREQRIQKGIKEFLGVTTKVRLVEPHSIPRSEGKAVRVIDRRVMQ